MEKVRNQLIQLSYDWFQVTFSDLDRRDELKWTEVVASIFENFGYKSELRTAPSGMNGYNSVRELFFNDEKIATFTFNATKDDQPMQMICTGSWAGLGKEIADYAMKEWRVSYYVTRVDVAYDFIGDFERVYRYLSKNRGAIKSKLVGDWESKKDGRTYYLGSNRSRAQIRFYEKGIEQMAKGVSDVSRNWLRLELQYRPTKRERDDTHLLTIQDFLGRVKWAYKLFRGVSGFGYENFVNVSVKRNEDDLVIARLFRTYFKRFSKVVDRCDACPNAIGGWFLERFNEERKRREKGGSRL